MFFSGSFFKYQITDIWNLELMKYLGIALSYLKNWAIWVNYFWNYGLLKLLLQFIEYRLYQLNNKHTKIVNSTIQYFEGSSQSKCLLKVWSFFVHPPQSEGVGGQKGFCRIKWKPSFNSQYFQTSRISDIWLNENA